MRGKQRNRAFAYSRYLAILEEGTEAIGRQRGGRCGGDLATPCRADNLAAMGAHWSHAVAIVLCLTVGSRAQEAAPPAPANEVAWSPDLATTLAKAKADSQPTLVFFTASWCVPCKHLKAQVCSTPEFAKAFAGHAFAMVDIDQDKAAAKAWQVGPIPDLRFVAADGEEIGGFVGERDLAGVLQARDAAQASAARAAALRTAVAAAPADVGALLALAEHLLQRPCKRPGVELLARVVLADGENQAGAAARAQWLVVGTFFHPIGRASAEDLADTQARLPAMAAWSNGDAPVYTLAVRAWLAWSDVMRQWSEQREREKNRELPLVVAADAPLRRTLAALAECGGKATAAAADAAADGVLIDGMLHYYAGDYATGIARLTEFTSAFPRHRWHDEGQRFLGISQRLLRERGGK